MNKIFSSEIEISDIFKKIASGILLKDFDDQIFFTFVIEDLKDLLKTKIKTAEDYEFVKFTVAPKERVIFYEVEWENASLSFESDDSYHKLSLTVKAYRDEYPSELAERERQSKKLEQIRLVEIEKKEFEEYNRLKLKFEKK
jgi:hypothetical protein